MKLSWPSELPVPSVRNAEEVRDVLAVADCPAAGPLYFMYRDLAASGTDRAWLSAHRIRYDLTEIPPRILCGEYVKTLGHYHPADPSGTPYPELYEVLSGEAHFLLQAESLLDIVMIRARVGDVVIVPPGYGHVTINPSDEPLHMANLVSSAFESRYEEFRRYRGAAYYEFAQSGVRKNPMYRQVPPIRALDAASLGTSTRFKPPIYELVGDEGQLSFLNAPVGYAWLRTLLREGWAG